MWYKWQSIRASVDTLCRNGISREPRTKRLLTWRESKTHSNTFGTHLVSPDRSYTPASSLARENPLTHHASLLIFRVIINPRRACAARVTVAEVSSLLVNAAQSSIPPAKHTKVHQNKVYDPHLSTLCWRSRVAFRQWKAAGSPRSGPLYDERKTCKKTSKSTSPSAELNYNAK